MGGASLLGSHLCERLVGEGHEVIAIDDFTTGSFSTLAHLERSPRFAFVEHDITQKFRAHVDAIFQLALPSSRRACETDPVRATVTGVMGTVHAFEIAAEHGARVVLATSAERWGQGVRCAESLAIDFVSTRKVDVRIVRVASAYGPRMSPDDPSIVTRLVLQALRGDELAPGVRTDAPVRLTYVDDAVETLVRTMGSTLRVPAVATPFVDTNVGAIAAAVTAASSGDASTNAASTPPSGPASLPPSLRGTTPEALPASIVFGQAHATDLREGIARTVQWFEACVGKRGAERTSGIFGPPPLSLPATRTA